MLQALEHCVGIREAKCSDTHSHAVALNHLAVALLALGFAEKDGFTRRHSFSRAQHLLFNTVRIEDKEAEPNTHRRQPQALGIALHNLAQVRQPMALMGCHGMWP